MVFVDVSMTAAFVSLSTCVQHNYTLQLLALHEL